MATFPGVKLIKALQNSYYFSPLEKMRTLFLTLMAQQSIGTALEHGSEALLINVPCLFSRRQQGRQSLVSGY